jgi:hypothetical protein
MHAPVIQNNNISNKFDKTFLVLGEYNYCYLHDWEFDEPTDKPGFQALEVLIKKLRKLCQMWEVPIRIGCTIHHDGDMFCLRVTGTIPNAIQVASLRANIFSVIVEITVGSYNLRERFVVSSGLNLGLEHVACAAFRKTASLNKFDIRMISLQEAVESR